MLFHMELSAPQIITLLYFQCQRVYYMALLLNLPAKCRSEKGDQFLIAEKQLEKVQIYYKKSRSGSTALGGSAAPVSCCHFRHTGNHMNVLQVPAGQQQSRVDLDYFLNIRFHYFSSLCTTYNICYIIYCYNTCQCMVLHLRVTRNLSRLKNV